MSLATACLWTLVRTLLLCLLAWPICVAVERWFRMLSDRWRPWAFGLLMGPCLFPELLVGYTYRNTALSSERLAEWICLGLLLVRIVPVGVVALLSSPSSLSGQPAIYCQWILVRANPRSARQFWRWCLCVWHGPVRRALPALGLMSVVAFQEFELAALLQTASWTDWFIAAERFGLDRSKMLSHAVWPIMLQLPLLVAVVRWTLNKKELPADQSDEVAVPRFMGIISFLYLSIAFCFGCLVPVEYLSTNLLAGLKMIARQSTQLTGLLQEISVAASISLCAALTTWSASRWFASSHNRLMTLGRDFLILPGLAGSLLLSLGSIAVFQQPTLRWLYDTPVPWVLVLMIWLLPRAVLVRLWLQTITQTESVHVAELLTVASRRSLDPSDKVPSDVSPGQAHSPSPRTASLLFRLRDQPRLLAIGLLFYWAYLDLSSAYLLAPSGMPSGLVRLYNFMHFGRSSALSAEAFLFFGLPVGAILILIGGWGMVRRWF